VVAGFLYRRRDWLAALPAVVLVALLLGQSLKQLTRLKSESAPITMMLAEEERAPSCASPLPCSLSPRRWSRRSRPRSHLEGQRQEHTLACRGLRAEVIPQVAMGGYWRHCGSKT
jgi:hypothetical protein